MNSASSKPAPDGRILAFHEKNPDAPTIPGDPDHVFASMGNYLFSTRTLLKALHEDAADRDQLARFRPRHSAQTGRRPAGHLRLRFPDQPDSRRAAGRAALLARRRHHRRLLGSQHGPALRQARAESLQPPVAAAHHQLSRSARQIHFRRRRPPRRGHRFHRLRRLHSLRRHGAEFRAGPRRQSACRRVWWRTA